MPSSRVALSDSNVHCRQVAPQIVDDVPTQLTFINDFVGNLDLPELSSSISIEVFSFVSLHLLAYADSLGITLHHNEYGLQVHLHKLMHALSQLCPVDPERERISAVEGRVPNADRVSWEEGTPTSSPRAVKVVSAPDTMSTGAAADAATAAPAAREAGSAMPSPPAASAPAPMKRGQTGSSGAAGSENVRAVTVDTEAHLYSHPLIGRVEIVVCEVFSIHLHQPFDSCEKCCSMRMSWPGDEAHWQPRACKERVHRGQSQRGPAASSVPRTGPILATFASAAYSSRLMIVPALLQGVACNC